MDKFKEVLPDWGPYSKKYAGISKVIDGNNGARFDLVVHPTIVNGNQPLPNVTFPSSYHPWEASYDLSYYSYRFDLEWKDKVYADVSFSKIDDKQTLIRTEIVNNTDLGQNCLVNYFKSLEYPYKTYIKLDLPENSVYIDATEYETYSYARPRPWDCLNPDGAKKGVFLDENFVNFKGLGDRVTSDLSQAPYLGFKNFGGDAQDKVSYTFNTDKDISNAYIVIKCKAIDEKPHFKVMIDDHKHNFHFNTKKELFSFKISSLKKGSHTLSLTSFGNSQIEFDFFVITNSPRDVAISKNAFGTIPFVTKNDLYTKLSYENTKEAFYFKSFGKSVRFRHINTGTLEDALINRLSNSSHTFDDVTLPFSKSFARKHSDDGFYKNTIAYEIFIQKNSSHIEYAIIGNTEICNYTNVQLEEFYIKAKSGYKPLSYKKDGEKFALSNQILKSTVLTNVVYPIYKHGEYIKHHTPGKRWDCLYTWDSGFIGLGLLEYDQRLSEYILDTYLSEPDNKDYAFLIHGSPVPVQIYLLLESIKKTQNLDYYKKYYERAKRYYNFLAGKSEGSTTNKFKSGITTTYDYFYNNSGMDDLPPQEYTHHNKLSQKVAPAICTSQVIRCAKILKTLAQKLDISNDVLEYTQDIEYFTNNLQKYSWHEDSGYFSYILHDDLGKPIDILKTADGENLNKTIDGIYPLIAGACTLKQEEIILLHLQSSEHMFSKVGISAVDQSASYFSNSGYWNGHVWFPHQWFIFKTMLDLGQADFAYKISDTALNSWKNEVDASYYTFEMLNIKTGRGGWFHNFGGLSTPINIWANTYYKEGTITSGFDMWIDKFEFNEDFTTCNLSIEKQDNTHNSVVIVCMSEKIKKDFKLLCNETGVTYKVRHQNTIEILVSKDIKSCEIKII